MWFNDLAQINWNALSWNRIWSILTDFFVFSTKVYFFCKEYVLSFFIFILGFKIYIILFLILFVTYKSTKFFWNYRRSISKFILFPQPLVRGVWFNFFHNFFKNTMTESMLELEKLLVSLPKNIVIILVLGMEDNLEEITTYYTSEELSWYFIRNSIYIYIKDKKNIQYIVSFLNRVRSTKPVHSLIIKGELNDDFNMCEHLKDIANISGIKVPVYLQINNIKWLEQISFLLYKEEYIGFLFDQYDLISMENIHNYFAHLRKVLLNKILLQKNFFPNFWFEYGECINILIDKLLYLYKGGYNIIRGIFFTTDKEKTPLKHMLRLGEESKTFFLNFHKYVIEKEAFIGEPFDANVVMIPRYVKYENTIFAIAMAGLLLYFVHMNNNMWLFNKTYKEYILSSTAALDNNTKNKSVYKLYEMLKKVSNIKLNPVYYPILPHNYLVNYLYESLCEIEEIFTFILINRQVDEKDTEFILSNKGDETDLALLLNYVNKVIDLESTLFNNRKVKRFGLYRERNKKSRESGKIIFEKSFGQIRKIYNILLQNFLNSYFSDDLKNQLNKLQNDLLHCFKNVEMTTEDISGLIKQYYYVNNLLKSHNQGLELQNLKLLLVKLEESIIFGDEVVRETLHRINSMVKEYELSLLSITNNMTGPILSMDENKNMIFSDKNMKIMVDLEKFLNEPFMDNNIAVPLLPGSNLISSWNINILKDGVETMNEAVNFQKNIGKYSEELRPILLILFKKKIATSIFSKIGMSQQIVPKEYTNLHNTLDAFTYINLLLQFFLDTGNTDYYYKLLAIFLHDFEIIDSYVESLLDTTIFFQYKKIDTLKQDKIFEFLFATNNMEKIKEILNNDIDRFIRIYHQYIEPIFKILNYDHFTNYRGTQYVKYRSITLDVHRFEKGINNSFNKFQEFIFNQLISYSIYDCYKDNIFGLENDTEIYLEDLLNNFKRNLVLQSQKLYNNELILSYVNFRGECMVFLEQFPFNDNFNEDNCVNVQDLYNFMHKNKNIITLFTHKNICTPDINQAMAKMFSLYRNIYKDSFGYYIEPSLSYNLPDSHTLHAKYIGLVNIGQSEEYPTYLLQNKIKLYFHLPVFMHIEVASNSHMEIMEIKSPNYSAKKYEKGICFIFPTIWHFLRFVYKSVETSTTNKIQIMVSVPIRVEKSIQHIKFNILLENFIFFPHHLPPV